MNGVLLKLMNGLMKVGLKKGKKEKAFRDRGSEFVEISSHRLWEN